VVNIALAFIDACTVQPVGVWVGALCDGVVERCGSFGRC